ncbi:hypothetical protein JCM3770_006928 [Rhodotorula araucariae]
MVSEGSSDPPAASALAPASPPAPTSAPPSTPAEAAPERTRHKRPRAAVDPGTPKGDGDEGKGLAGLTPAAKKGRVEDEDDVASDTDRATTPPPPTKTSASRPSTPSNPAAPVGLPTTEGKDTKQLRERVEAMKPPGQTGEADDESAPAAHDTDVEIAEVADEVSASAAKLGDEQDEKEERDVEIAEVAAEVGKSAENLANEDERQEQEAASTIAEDASKQAADVAAEVGESAAEVQAEDEKIADIASEVADAAKAAPEPTPAPTPKPTATGSQPTFTNYSSTASPFSAFASSASPLASVSTPPKPAAEEQKPKAKSAFSASPFLSSSVPPAVPAASTSMSEQKLGATPAAERPTTPFTKAAPTTDLAAASPFSGFASTSGFASAGKPGGSSAFSAFSTAPSAFSSVPSTPAKAGLSDEGTDSAKEGSAPAPEEGEGQKRIYTEQETVTGEEEEQIVHSVRCKLYAMHEGQWAERGTGVLKLNETKKAEDKKGARLLMRADATHRLLLNTPLFAAFSIEVHSEKYVRFSAIEGSTPTSYMLRTGNPTAASTLVKAVQDKVATL